MAKYPSDKMLRERFLPDHDHGIPEKDKATAKKLKSMNALVLHAAKDVRDLFEGEVVNCDEIMDALAEFQAKVVATCRRRAGVTPKPHHPPATPRAAEPADPAAIPDTGPAAGLAMTTGSAVSAGQDPLDGRQINPSGPPKE